MGAIEKIKYFFSSLSRRKHIKAADIIKTQLSRCLSLVDLTALGIGSTLGAGVYVVVGEVARTSAGPGVILSFLIAALSSILSGLCYAEFGARVPKTGSAYIYSYVAVGELMAFVTGWNLILQYIIGTSSVARAWSSNFDGIVNGQISGFFSKHLAMNATGLADYFDPFAFGITVAVTGVLSVGAQESSLVNNVFTLINLGVISYVTITGLFRVKLANWQVNPEDVPPDDPNRAHVGAGGFLPFGISGVISGAGTCFYSFVGFDIIATTGEEVRNPQRAIPIAIMACLLTCFVAYAAISAVLTLMVPYYKIPTIAPLPYAFESVGWNVARYVIAVGAVCALTTSLLGSMFPLPRILYAMASDGLIFRFFGRINKRFRTPLIGTVISGTFAGILAAVFSLKDLVDMMSIGTLLAYSLVAVSVLILRGQQSSICVLPSDDNRSATIEPYGDDIFEVTLPANDDGVQTSTHRQPWTTVNQITPGCHYESSERKNSRTNSVSPQDRFTSSAPCSFKQYIKLCFTPRRDRIEPTPTSQWITVTNTYLLLLVIICLNAGLIYFDGRTAEYGEFSFVASVATIVVFGILALLICVSLQMQPENKSPVTFKVPGVPWLPALSILVNLHLMFKMSGITWIYYAVWMFFGFLIYFAYGYWKSTERKRENETDADASIQLERNSYCVDLVST